MMKRLPSAILLIVVMAVFLIIGCGNRDKAMNEEKSQLQERINTTLTTVNERIDAYQSAMADTALSPQNQATLNTSLSTLQEVRTDLTARIDRMAGVTRDEWPAFRDETNTSLNQADQRLQQIPAQPPVMAPTDTAVAAPPR